METEQHEQQPATRDTYVRKPYTGSCHCGLIRFVVYLTLPSPIPEPGTHISPQDFREKSGLKIYRCNCTVCHKMGFFHLRVRSPPDDFMVLTPVEPYTPDHEGSGVKVYRCNAGVSDWYFCGTCGVRTFTIRAEKEMAGVELPFSVLSGGKGDGRDESGEGVANVKTKVWKIKKDAWTDRGYLSVNMVTLDHDGLDLRRLQEWGVVEYGDGLHRQGGWQATPYEGGMY